MGFKGIDDMFKWVKKQCKDDETCVLERSPLENLANDGQLAVHTHDGFWQCMDTYRDYVFLNELWDSNEAQW